MAENDAASSTRSSHSAMSDRPDIGSAMLDRPDVTKGAFWYAYQLAQLQLRNRSTRTTLLYSLIRKYFDLAMREGGWRGHKETVGKAAETFGVGRRTIERARCCPTPTLP